MTTTASSVASGTEEASGVAPVRIVVIDDHTLFRRGLIALLAREPGFAIVGEAADGFEGIRAVGAHRPDVVLLDLHMPGISGLDAIDAIRKEAPEARVVMLTVSEDADDLLAALRAGASGYLLKNIDSEFLVSAIRRAADGDAVVSPEMTGKLVQEVRTRAEPAPDAVLSAREREILTHVARGASNKEIARALDVAESTVKIHVQHILRKLNLGSRVQAAIWAVENGVTSRG
jgi:two-component system nitrate/nitrite response regulator NarL